MEVEGKGEVCGDECGVKDEGQCGDIRRWRSQKKGCRNFSDEGNLRERWMSVTRRVKGDRGINVREKKGRMSVKRKVRRGCDEGERRGTMVTASRLCRL